MVFMFVLFFFFPPSTLHMACAVLLGLFPLSPVDGEGKKKRENHKYQPCHRVYSTVQRSKTQYTACPTSTNAKNSPQLYSLFGSLNMRKNEMRKE